ncbi:peptide deformylase, mitochondrial S homeolog [Xenopus laevis]|uniref:Peptide deformylase n=1 Tax=Xenopus laevis TaxID=8355 RepID=A9UM23_XENLA|nr:peptide deformylase, mitochondrial S homeolog [Xenopus laevis]AAI57494.1 LOC100137680 protein [Xenopus laevis]
MLLQRGCRAVALLLSPYSNTLLPNVTHVPRRLSSSSWTLGKKRSYWRYLRRRVLGAATPPYSRVTQTGDPVLRCTAACVPSAHVSHPDTQAIVNQLVRVLSAGCCVGISAPQLGVPLRILAVAFPEQMCQAVPPEVRQAREMSPFPLQIFINPEMRILNSQTLSFPEGCSSVQGFSAVVPRYYAVEISGLNPKGEHITWQAQGWAARIIQHEMDHLDGVLYIDKMDPRTFVNISWMEVND